MYIYIYIYIYIYVYTYAPITYTDQYIFNKTYTHTHIYISNTCVHMYDYVCVKHTPLSKSLASVGAQAECQSIDTHFGILTAHDNHKMGLFCQHKLIDVH